MRKFSCENNKIVPLRIKYIEDESFQENQFKEEQIHDTEHIILDYSIYMYGYDNW